MEEAYVEFRLDEVQHGWFGVAISIDGRLRFVDDISYTPNDGFAEFLYAINAIVAHHGSHSECSWSNEPGYFAISLANHDPLLDFTMRYVPEYADEPNEQHEVILAFTCDLRQFARQVYKNYRNVLDSYGAADFAERWRSPFPVAELEKLMRQIREISPRSK